MTTRISCIAVLLCLLGTVDFAVASASDSVRTDVLAAQGFKESPVFSSPTRDGEESPAAHHSAPFLLETSLESELEESDPDDSSLPTSRSIGRRTNLALSMRAHFLRPAATILGSPDARGPPHA